MNIKVYPKKLNGKIAISASKSVAHRMMICASLASLQTKIVAMLKGTDVDATAECLNRLGGNIQIFENYTTVSPILEKSEDKCELYCKDSGSTFRFMLPVASALGANAVFSGTKRLASRPVSELREVLSQHGITFSSDTLPFEISGVLQSGKYEIDATISSQYITGLLLALPLCTGDSQIILKGRAVSTDYISITISTMKLFGIEVQNIDGGFFIRGNQKYISPAVAPCEGDWSSACFFAVAGGIGGGISLENIFASSLQGDKEILNFISTFGGFSKLYLNDDGVECYSFETGELIANTFHTENIPDIVPILAVMCAFAKGTSEIIGIKRLKDKESDRLTETIKMLEAFGIDSYTNEDSLFVVGGSPTGGYYHVPDDHRMAMASIILATYAEGESEIFDVDCISKSYPHFLDDYKKLGGNFNVLGI